MGIVPALLKSRWKSRNLTGEAKHQLVVRVRRGFMDHGYFDTARLDNGSPIYPPLIWEGHNHSPWQAKWVVEGPWITIPNVQSSKWLRDFTAKGSSTLTVVVDNIAFHENTGVSGIYHTIQRGYFSPMRGSKVFSRPDLWATNSWHDVLNGGYQIEIWEGYGPDGDASVTPLATPVAGTCAPAGAAISRTWTGIIEDCEMESHPDHITITARDFAIYLTDQRLLGWNKAREIRAPITFADRRWTQGERKEYGSAKVSSGAVASGDATGAVWTSNGQVASATTQWVEIHLPAGYYTDFFLAPSVDGMEMWVSLNVGAGGGVMDHTHPISAGWLDLSSGATVPGAAGGEVFIRHMGNVNENPSRRWGLGHGFDLPAGSILRLSFNKLQHLDPGKVPDGPAANLYYAGTDAFYTFRYGTNPSNPPGAQVNAKHWILVEDAAEVVRMIFIWAGFKEWHVEDFGWTIARPMQFGQDKFMMDVIDEILKQGNFVFYMTAPSNDDMSLGIPHLEHQTATNSPKAGMLELRDADMAEAATVKWDVSNLPYVMRYRGEINPNGHLGMGQDLVRRFMAVYFPPWSGQDYAKLNGKPTSIQDAPRLAGLRRHFYETLGVQTTIGLQSDQECMFACLLAAVQYALQMCTGEVTIPGYPGVELNQQISVIDEGTGINSRMWVAAIQSDHIMGEKGSWKMKIGGSYIDTEDMYMLAGDYVWAYLKYLKTRAPAGEDRPAPLPDPGIVDIIKVTT